MTDIILRTACRNCTVKEVALYSSERVDGSAQAGVIELSDAIADVLTINLHQLTVPIVSPGPNKALLRLSCGPVDLNGFHSRNLSYAIGVPLKQEFTGDLVREFTWPSPMFPFFSAERRPDHRLPTLGARWTYEWIQTDGTAYPITTDWSAEFFVVVRCKDCLQ